MDAKKQVWNSSKFSMVYWSSSLDNLVRFSNRFVVVLKKLFSPDGSALTQDHSDAGCGLSFATPPYVGWKEVQKGSCILKIIPIC